MITQVISETIHGLDIIKVIINVEVSDGLPSFDITGLPAIAIKETKERIKMAIRNSNLPFPLTKIKVNIEPKTLYKNNSGLDLPIAIGILTASKTINQEATTEKIFIGELSIDGYIKKVPGVLPMIRNTYIAGLKEIYIPSANKNETELCEHLNIYTPQTLSELVEHLNGKHPLKRAEKPCIAFNPDTPYDIDFADIKGQEKARRALEIVAAGGHNFIMVGSPGCGKTALARRLTTILPPMTRLEVFEVAEIYSICNMLPLNENIKIERPFRSPHHSISPTTLLGDETKLKIGEITLAHNGVLFLDEITEFETSTLSLLSEPTKKHNYPSNFILCAAQNPCPCGYLLDKTHKCTCKEKQIYTHNNKIPKVLKDKFDIQINLTRVEYLEIKKGESSAEIRKRVIKAHEKQQLRFFATLNTNTSCNAQMTSKEIIKFCTLDKTAESILKKYTTALHLDKLQMERILKIARTIADLDNSDIIKAKHIAEAIEFRAH